MPIRFACKSGSASNEANVRSKSVFNCLFVIAAACCFDAPQLCSAESPLKASINTIARPIEITGIHNAFRVTEKIFSGSQPEGDAAFAALARLGVKTIVSVDGSKPDVETARKHGIRYVHLPFGYDGVPTNRLTELAKVAMTQPGSFFVHCHHGLHRGPTAVAVMCEAAERWPTNRAEAWMREAGTSTDYPGLYRSAREFQKPTAAQLDTVTELPEITKPSSLVEAMVAIDEHFSRLKASQKAGWKTPPGQADISSPHEATMLWEQFREMARTAETAKRPEDYRAKLTDAERAADSLRKLLRESSDHTAVDAAFKHTTQSCGACHKKYRNE
jgi:protein tyrosine phosphatase (PTP) superfamily phosphohydrolase (DUF442 family)